MSSLVPIVLRSSSRRMAGIRVSSSSQSRHMRSLITKAPSRASAFKSGYGWNRNRMHHPICSVASFTSSSTSSSDNKKDEEKTTSKSKDETKTTTTTSTSGGASGDSTSTTATKSQPKKGENMEFKAETKQLLDIVTNSLYTDKEVFLRELISNASDALEKLRHLQTTNAVETIDSDQPLEIRIEIDEVKSSITITDTGVGMTREEMIENLGTIAKSGSKAFMNQLEEMKETKGASAALDMSRGIIGKFGVGFYSAFMVGDTVEVRSKSALAKHEKDTPKVWTSAGEGSYEISDVDDNIRIDRGSSVVIYLKEDYWEYCNEAKIEKILKRYSNFVNFPIYVNGKRVNTQEALWSKDPKEVTEEKYRDFYKYLTNNVDDPLDVLHFRVDAPLDVKALFFVPSFHTEKYGMGRMEPGVSLYSRKVLIEAKSPDILPDWMRFVKGVVDSEDLPLTISREKSQGTALINKLRKVLTRKFIVHLGKMVKNDKSKYVDEFYKEYSFFLKEGICQDHEFQDQLSKLLFFETSKNMNEDMLSLDDYISKMRPEQKDIYYLCAPTRDAAMNSPYLEAFQKANVEVIFLFSAIEDFVMANLEKYEGRKLVSVEKGDIDLSDLMPSSENDKGDKNDTDEAKGSSVYQDEANKLTPEQALDFCTWFKKELGETKIHSCTVTSRLVSSPAIVTDNESGAMRRMMRLVDTSDGNRDYIPLPKQHVEINPSHHIIIGLNNLRDTQPALAKVLAEQIYDNCLIGAGLLDDSRSMLPRLNDILVGVVKAAKDTTVMPDDKKNAPTKVLDAYMDGGSESSDSDSDSASDSSSDSASDSNSDSDSESDKQKKSADSEPSSAAMDEKKENEKKK